MTEVSIETIRKKILLASKSAQSLAPGFRCLASALELAALDMERGQRAYARALQDGPHKLLIHKHQTETIKEDSLG